MACGTGKTFTSLRLAEEGVGVGGKGCGTSPRLGIWPAARGTLVLVRSKGCYRFSTHMRRSATFQLCRLDWSISASGPHPPEAAHTVHAVVRSTRQPRRKLNHVRGDCTRCRFRCWAVEHTVGAFAAG